MVEITQKIVNTSCLIYFIFALILLSAIVIGLETYPELAKHYHDSVLSLMDKIIIAIFTIEIL